MRLKAPFSNIIHLNLPLESGTVSTLWLPAQTRNHVFTLKLSKTSPRLNRGFDFSTNGTVLRCFDREHGEHILRKN